jgi:hypothetical protein
VSPDPLPPRPPLPELPSPCLLGLGAAAADVAPLLPPAAPGGPPALLLLLTAALSLLGDLRLRIMLAAPAAALAALPPLQEQAKHSAQTTEWHCNCGVQNHTIVDYCYGRAQGSLAAHTSRQLTLYSAHPRVCTQCIQASRPLQSACHVDSKPFGCKVTSM